MSDKPVEHDLWKRNLQSHVEDLLTDHHLVTQMEMDAQKLTKYTAGEWERFVDEPCTARRFWEVQVSTAVPLPIR